MKKIFLDCGAHCGCSRKKFKAKYNLASEFIIYSFEPNILFNEYCSDLINSAAWIYDGEITWFQFGYSGGSTLDTQKASILRNRKPFKQEVKDEQVNSVICFDIDKYIKQFKKNDYIILKLDIEGAEYKVLKHMIENGSIDFIDELFIEWHDWRCNVSKSVNIQLENYMKTKGIKINNQWDAMEVQYCQHKDMR